MELISLLPILKYAGFIFATFSTIWGLTKELYIKDDDGKRHLTTAGKAAIVVTVLSLLVSLNTAVLESVLKNRAEQAIKEEGARKQQEDTLARIAQAHQQSEIARQQSEKIDESTRKTLIDASERERREISRIRELLTRQDRTLFDVNRTINPIYPIAFQVKISYHASDPKIKGFYENVIKEAEKLLAEGHVSGKGNFKIFGNTKGISFISIDNMDDNLGFRLSEQPTQRGLGKLVNLLFIFNFHKSKTTMTDVESIDPEGSLSYGVLSYNLDQFVESLITQSPSFNFPSGIVESILVFPNKQQISIEVASNVLLANENGSDGTIASLLDLPDRLITLDFHGNREELGQTLKLEAFWILTGAGFSKAFWIDGEDFIKQEDESRARIRFIYKLSKKDFKMAQ